MREWARSNRTEQTNSEPNWSTLSGTVLEGGYEIGELLEADSGRARFRIRVLGDRSLEAFADVFRAPGTAAEDQLAIWQSIKESSHRNLNVPLAFGRLKADDSELIYTVLRKPDETLSGVLRERALTAPEAGEVLLSVSAGLAHLHQLGFVHGCLSPQQVFATGDSINVSSECIRRSGAAPGFEIAASKYRAPESAGENVTPSADIWCLGATLFEVLTQKECDGDCRQRASQLPGRFGKIVERCLDPDPSTRCSLTEILSLYREEPKPVTQPQPSTAPRVSAAPEPRRVQAPPAKPSPARRPSPAPQAHAQYSWLKPLVYSALAFFLVLLVIWAARPKHPTVAQTPVPKAAPETPLKPAPGSAWETRTLPPARPSRELAKAPQPAHANSAAANATDSATGQIWRVVLFTYNHQEPADKKALSLNQSYPELHAEVFSPNGHRSLYLITIGGRMSREDAARLRQKALSLGMPRDSYIQNYRQ